jgi:hypothetical protein
MEYSVMKRLDDKVREQFEKDIVEILMNDPDKYKGTIQEMVEFFITELGVADFARLYETITKKRIKS